MVDSGCIGLGLKAVTARVQRREVYIITGFRVRFHSLKSKVMG